MIEIFQKKDQIDREQWGDLLQYSSHRSAFQTPECYAFYESLSFMEAFVFGVSEDDVLKGVIVGFVIKDGGKIKQYLSRRAIINGGPLLADDISEKALKVLLETCVKSLKVKAIYVESRNFNDYSKWKTVFGHCGFEYEPHYNFHIDTSNLVVVDENMGKSRKRDVKSSLRNGAEIICADSVSQVQEYYSILSDLYKTKVKTPLFPFEFFEKLFISKFGWFILVKLKEKIIGGTLCVSDENTVYEWFACGEDAVYKNIYPSTLATFAGIEFAAKTGRKRFDMMGAGTPGDGGYGVRDFKAKFGGKLVEHGRYLHVNNRFLFSIGKKMVYLIKR